MSKARLVRASNGQSVRGRAGIERPKGRAVTDPFFDHTQTIDVLGILQVLRRRKWLIATVVLVGTLAAGMYGKQLTPEYTATASIMIEPEESQVIDVEAVRQGLSLDQTGTLGTQMRLLQTPAFAARVMEDLDLFNTPAYNPTLEEADVNELPLKVGEPFKSFLSWLPDEWLIATGLAQTNEPLLESEAPALLRERAVGRFLGDLEVANDIGSYILSVSFTSPRREQSALIANRIAEIYVDERLQGRLIATDRASLWLRDRLNEMQEEVQKAEASVEQFRARNDLLDSEGVTLNEQELSSLNGELIVARGELAQLQAQIDLIRQLQRSGQGLDAIAEVMSSPVIVRLRDQETQLLREEAEAASLYGERHPRMALIQREREQLAGTIDTEVERVVRNLQNQAQVAATRIRTIENELNGITAVNVRDREAEVRLRELERQAEASRELYEAFLQRFKETSEQIDLIESDVRIVSVATPPVSASTPGTKLFAAAGFVVSFVLATGIALLLERMDRGLRNAREVEASLGLPTIGLVPKLDKLKRKQRPHQYLLEKPLSAYAEAVRAVYMAVKLSSVDHPPKVILVTSSLPQEGKTTLAVSLAAFVARSHKRVLLIDLDLRHPSVHRELSFEISSGLVEYMANDRTLEEIIHHDLETKLDFLPIKGQTTDPTDLLESHKMRELIAQCRESYDYVVIDSAPLLSVTDTRIATMLADKVVFALQWGETIEGAAIDSIEILNSVNADVVGTVLTQVDLKKHAQYDYGDIGQYYNKSQAYYVN
ncbi:MAG: polysaccharide biosynthesis tyrosine autokinase [Cyanobacteria bacterium J06638_22]